MAKRGVDYAPHEIDKALTTLAYYGGNSARAGKELGISDSTLRDWRTKTHRDRYLEIAEREGPRLEALAASQAREAILRSADVEHTIFDRLLGEDDAEPTTKELSELAGALQRVTTSKGINTTKLLELTGRPTVVTEHREGADVLKELRARVPWMFVDSTATELPNLPLPPQIDDANARDLAPSQPAD